MKVLVVGGAGYVASIVRSGLEAEHDCWYFDRAPVPGRKSRTVVGDVLDESAVKRAARGMSAILYMAMGVPGRHRPGVAHKNANDLELAFRVNVAGFYNVARLADARCRSLIYASSISVYAPEITRGRRRDENDPPDGFYPYAMSKRAGELVAAAAAQHHPKLTVLSLRLYAPRNAADFAQSPRRWKNGRYPVPTTGPGDTTRLFLAALNFRKPGHHIIQATGDTHDELFDHSKALELLGWEPRGE